jgi:hypothetical protein
MRAMLKTLIMTCTPFLAAAGAYAASGEAVTPIQCTSALSLAKINLPSGSPTAEDLRRRISWEAQRAIRMGIHPTEADFTAALEPLTRDKAKAISVANTCIASENSNKDFAS